MLLIVLEFVKTKSTTAETESVVETTSTPTAERKNEDKCAGFVPVLNNPNSITCVLSKT